MGGTFRAHREHKIAHRIFVSKPTYNAIFCVEHLTVTIRQTRKACHQREPPEPPKTVSPQSVNCLIHFHDTLRWCDYGGAPGMALCIRDFKLYETFHTA
jgi:hypothetical protein